MGGPARARINGAGSVLLIGLTLAGMVAYSMRTEHRLPYRETSMPTYVASSGKRRVLLGSAALRCMSPLLSDEFPGVPAVHHEPLGG